MTRLLLDKDMSFKIAKRIKCLFPETKHTSDVNLSGESDIEIWKYARSNNYCIAIFNSDFIELSFLLPKNYLVKIRQYIN